jgi:hypothetical protein
VSSKPFFRDRDTSLYIGLGMLVLGTVLVWDAYERRGQPRPLMLRVFTYS